MSTGLPIVAEPSPFASSALFMRRHGLAVIPVGGDDGKAPLVKWGMWNRRPSETTIVSLVARIGRANIGIVCGLSGLTVVDIDDPSIVGLMIDRFGDTPIKIGTPSGGTHLYYRHTDERSTNLRGDGLAVDIKARGGFVVAPPSIRLQGPKAGERYRFLSGSWADLTHLPMVRPGSMPVARRGRPRKSRPDETPKAKPASSPARNGDIVREGERNSTLFAHLRARAPHCDDLAALLDVAEAMNANFRPPLPAAEVERTVQSVWGFRGTVGSRPERAEIVPLCEPGELDALSENPEALCLLLVLRRTHGARRALFAVSPKAMAKAGIISGWGPKRYAAACRWLVEHGFLRVEREGGKGPGDVRLFTLVSPTDPSAIAAGTPIAARRETHDDRFDLPASVGLAEAPPPAAAEWRSLAPLGFPAYSINAAGTIRREVAGRGRLAPAGAIMTHSVRNGIAFVRLTRLGEAQRAMAVRDLLAATFPGAIRGELAPSGRQVVRSPAPRVTPLADGSELVEFVGIASPDEIAPASNRTVSTDH